MQGAQLQPAVIRQRLDQGYLDATALMEAIMQQGMPQRTAHHRVGALVALAKSKGVTLAELSDADFTAVDPSFVGSVLRKSLGVDGAVASYRSEGSSRPEYVKQQVAAWKQRLRGEGDRT